MTAESDDALGWRGPLLATTLGMVVAVGLLEWGARSRPPDRVQVVDLDSVDAEVVDGVPIWRSAQSTPERMGTACSGKPEVVLAGSSIFFGSGVDDGQSLRPLLAERLSGACVRSVAEPGYTFFNQRAALSRHLAESTPRIVVWEVWRNSPNRWSLVDGVAYNFGYEALDTHDLPSPFGLSAGPHRQLFTWLATYRHLVISRLDSSGVRWDVVWKAFVADELGPEVAKLQSRGITVVLAFMPPLHQPFQDTLAETSDPYQVVRAELAGKVQMVTVAEGLAARNADVEAVRVDTCCHFAPSGNALVADVLADVLQPMLAGPSSP